MAETPFAALARVTGARKGLITDAGTDDEFAAAVLQALEQQQDVRTKRAVIHPDRTPVFDVLRGDGALAPHRLTLEQSNTSIALWRASDRQAVPAGGTRTESRCRNRRAPHGPHGFPPGAAGGRRVRVSGAGRASLPSRGGARAGAEPGGRLDARAGGARPLLRSRRGTRRAARERVAVGPRPGSRCPHRRRRPWAMSRAPSSIQHTRSVAVPRSCTWRSRRVRPIPRSRRSLCPAPTSIGCSAKPAWKPGARSISSGSVPTSSQISQTPRSLARASGAGARRVRTELVPDLDRRPHARARRLPPRSGPVGGGGLLHPGLRRRAVALARGSPDEGVAVEGCRRHAPVVQLRGVRGALLTHRGAQVRVRASGTMDARLADLGECRLPEGLPGADPHGSRPSGRRPPSNARCSICSCWTRPCTS